MSDQYSSVAGADQPAVRRQWLIQQHQLLLTAWLRVKKSPGLAAIHDLRVAARRLRTVLKYWRKELHPLHNTELRFVLRNLGRLLGPMRETDIRRQLITRLLRPLPEALTHSANLLFAELDRTRAAERARLRLHIHSDRWQKCMARIQELIVCEQLPALPRPTPEHGKQLLKFAKDLRRLRKACARKTIPASQLHTLRIKGKNIRYIGELLSEQSTQDLTTELHWLRQLQEVLGDLHDSLQIENWLQQQQLDPSLQELLQSRLATVQKLQRRRFEQLRSRKRVKLLLPILIA